MYICNDDPPLQHPGSAPAMYRKRTNFCGHNISWIKFLRGLIFMGKSSPPYLLLLILCVYKFLWGCLPTKISPRRKFLRLRYVTMAIQPVMCRTLAWSHPDAFD